MPTTVPDPYTLEMDGVRARRGGVEVIRGVSLAFEVGSRTVVVGPSGSGKSTFLRLLNRLAEPSAGRITLAGIPLTARPEVWVRREIGLVPASPRPFPGTIRDNLLEAVAYPPRPAWPIDPASLLDEVGLDPAWLDRDAAGLSGGERQRLALAVALGVGPSILALDEPTAALDPTAAARIADALRLRSDRDGLTTIVVTHARDQAVRFGPRCIVLDAGQVVDDGPTARVIERLAGLVPDGVA